MLQNRRAAYRESLREDILDAARQLFVNQGYEATSIRNIAAKVGCSPGILYHYFEDKQDIMALLIRETFQKLSARLEAIVSDRDGVEARLRRGLRAYMDFGAEYPHHYALLFMKPTSWEGNEKVIAVFHEEGMRTFECLRYLSRESIEARILRPELKDVEEMAQTLWAAIHGLVSVHIGAKGFPFLERSRLVDRLVDILMRGILAETRAG
jgi:AcrR family transcriptional regulator